MATGQSRPTNLGMEPNPRFGRRTYKDVLDFVAQTSYTRNLMLADVGLDMWQGVFIDNSDSAQELIFYVLDTEQQITIAPYCQAFFPILSSGANINYKVTSGGGVAQSILLLNFKPELFIWSTQSAGNILNVVTVQGEVVAAPKTAVYTNRSNSLTTGGTSKQLCAANANRKRLFIMNPTDETGQGIAVREPVYINFTAAAGVNDGDSIELQPGASFDTGLGPVSTEAVNFNAATTGHKIICREM